MANPAVSGQTLGMLHVTAEKTAPTPPAERRDHRPPVVATPRRRRAVPLLLVLVLAGCGTSLPRDPEGTLDRVTGGTLRVGVSFDPPWTEVPAGGADLSDRPPPGVEPRLVADFAASLDADVRWTAGGEETLIGELEEGRLDVVVGGLTAASPWSEKVALTRPYVTLTDAHGKPEPHVMAAPMGENAFLVELEMFLLEQPVQEVTP